MIIEFGELNAILNQLYKADSDYLTKLADSIADLIDPDEAEKMDENLPALEIKRV